MRSLIVLCLVLFSSMAYADFYALVPEATIHDGDSLINVPGIAARRECVVHNLRLKGIDAPEIRGEEKEQGLKAREHLVKLLGDKVARFHVYGRDKFGRCLVDVFADGKHINRTMVADGFAEEYK